MSTPPIRLGAIGTGLAMEKLHWPALRQLQDRFTLTAFAERDQKNADRFVSYSGADRRAHHADYRALLERKDVDAVAILLPIPLLYDAARAALEAGKHVLCEKTPGVDLEQGRAFLELERCFPNQRLLVAENFFYRDDLRLARSLLEGGAIGRLHTMTWRMVSQYVPDLTGRSFSSTPWRQRPQYRGGPHLDGGVHMVSQIRLLCGDVHKVHGLVQHANTQMGGPSDLSLNLRFVSGAIGSYVSLHPEIPVPRDEARGMRLYGSEGTMTFSGNFGEATRTVTVHRPTGSSGSGEKLAAEEHVVANTDGGYYNEWHNFHDAVVHGAPIVGTVAQSFHNMLVVLRGLDSAEGEGEVDLASDAPTPLSERPIPLWRPHGAEGLFDGLPCGVSNPTRR
ncbi:MAG TPA: Gfo/Idh/MocA family oxidoreductase [Chloroflexota bacterium]|nr:Gfo/Idh/MocA family oxidoreductase [Chloroflexota bacterium]